MSSNSDNYVNFIKFIYNNAPPELYNHYDLLIKKINKKEYDSNINNYLKYLHNILEQLFLLNPYDNEWVLATQYNKSANKYLYETKKEYIQYEISPLNVNLKNISPVKQNNTLRNKISIKIKEYLNKYYSESDLHKKIVLLKDEPITDIKQSFISNLYVDALDVQEKDQFGYASYVGYTNEEIYILIVAQNYAYSSNQTFKWKSYYKLILKSNEFKGWVKLNNYYFENNNNSNFNLDEELDTILIKSKNEDDIANDIYNIISKFEGDLHKKLSDLFNNIEQDIMKPLHRGLSLIGTNMNWDLDFSDLASVKK